MAAQVSVRQAERSDCTKLAALCAQLGYPTTSEEEVSSCLDRIEADEDHAVFVAELDGEVVGWVELWKRSILVAQNLIEVEGLVVDETVRGQGVGRALMQQVEVWGRSHGGSRIHLRTNIIRHSAHQFYEHLGYSLVKQQRVYQKLLA